MKFVLDNLHLILALILAVLSFVGTITSYAISMKKAKTDKEKTAVKEQALENLKNSINNFIIDAEKMRNYSGAERKQYVMSRAIVIAKGLMTEDEIDEYVETQVHLTDCVNKHS